MRPCLLVMEVRLSEEPGRLEHILETVGRHSAVFEFDVVWVDVFGHLALLKPFLFDLLGLSKHGSASYVRRGLLRI